MDRFSVTRHAARQTLQNLVMRGLAVKDRSGGTAVRHFSGEEIRGIYEVREVLQQRVLERIELPVSSDTAARLEAIHKEYSAAVKARDLGEVFRLNDTFHEAVFDAYGNAVLAKAIRHHAWLTHGVRSRFFGDATRLQLAMADHEKIIETLATGDRRQLLSVSRRHLLRPMEAYLGIGDAKVA